MPLNTKGKKIMKAMKKEYGKNAEKVFYASKNKGVIKNVEKKTKKKK
jgi:hypothetical protein